MQKLVSRYENCSPDEIRPGKESKPPAELFVSSQRVSALFALNKLLYFMAELITSDK